MIQSRHPDLYQLKLDQIRIQNQEIIPLKKVEIEVGFHKEVTSGSNTTISLFVRLREPDQDFELKDLI